MAAAAAKCHVATRSDVIPLATNQGRRFITHWPALLPPSRMTGAADQHLTLSYSSLQFLLFKLPTMCPVYEILQRKSVGMRHHGKIAEYGAYFAIPFVLP